MKYLKNFNTLLEYEDAIIIYIPNVSYIVLDDVVKYSKVVKGGNNVILYTTTDNQICTPYYSNVFGANIISNTYENGLGVIKFDGEVTSIGRLAFSYCSSLTSITIPNSVTSVGDTAFYGCSSLTSITIPNSVTSIGDDAFCNCSSLTSITIPNSVTSVGDDAFYKCSGLTDVTIGNSVASIGEKAFFGCSSLSSINVDSNNPNYSSVDGVVFNKDKTTLIQYPIGNTRSEYIIPNSVISIGGWAFRDCKSLTSVTINSDAIVNKAYSSSYNLSDIFGSQVTKYIIGDNVKGIGDWAFGDCHSLTSVTIPNSVTSIGRYAFSDCTSLPSLTIPNSVTSIGEDAFEDCSSLTSVTIPNGVTSIEHKTFYGCSSLTSIVIPNSVTSIGEQAFNRTGIYTNEANWENDVLYINDCLISAKSSISGAYKIKAGTRLIADYAFYYCSSLTSVTIHNSVTSIGDHAFAGCSSLTSVTIPNSVTSVDDWAFYRCSSLTSITCKAVTPPTLGAYNGLSNVTTVYVPAESVNAYKAATNWSYYANKIKPIQ